MPRDEIENWRRRIDQIDRKLLKLLNQRSKCAIAIGKVKRETKLSIYDPQREKQVLENVKSANSGPLSHSAITRLFRLIIKESKGAEQRHRKNLIKSTTRTKA